jgi:putative toxin-antitoxin system antitoxin component (TIGR02293 family)
MPVVLDFHAQMSYCICSKERVVANPQRAKPPVIAAKRPIRRRAVGRLRATVKNYAGVFHAAPAERITLIKNGVPASFVVDMAKSMGASKEGLVRTLGLSRATIDRKIKKSAALSADEGQRVIGMAKLVGLVETMAEQSGSAKDFDAAKWLAKWIEQQLPAFGGKKPADFLDTAEGQDLVASTLQRMQSGAYS